MPGTYQNEHITVDGCRFNFSFQIWHLKMKAWMLGCIPMACETNLFKKHFESWVQRYLRALPFCFDCNWKPWTLSNSSWSAYSGLQISHLYTKDLFVHLSLVLKLVRPWNHFEMSATASLAVQGASISLKQQPNFESCDENVKLQVHLEINAIPNCKITLVKTQNWMKMGDN